MIFRNLFHRQLLLPRVTMSRCGGALASLVVLLLLPGEGQAMARLSLCSELISNSKASAQHHSQPSPLKEWWRFDSSLGAWRIFRSDQGWIQAFYEYYPEFWDSEAGTHAYFYEPRNLRALLRLLVERVPNANLELTLGKIRLINQLQDMTQAWSPSILYYLRHSAEAATVPIEARELMLWIEALYDLSTHPEFGFLRMGYQTERELYSKEGFDSFLTELHRPETWRFTRQALLRANGAAAAERKSEAVDSSVNKPTAALQNSLSQIAELETELMVNLMDQLDAYQQELASHNSSALRLGQGFEDRMASHMANLQRLHDELMVIYEQNLASKDPKQQLTESEIRQIRRSFTVFADKLSRARQAVADLIRSYEVQSITDLLSLPLTMLVANHDYQAEIPSLSRETLIVRFDKKVVKAFNKEPNDTRPVELMQAVLRGVVSSSAQTGLKNLSAGFATGQLGDLFEAKISRPKTHARLLLCWDAAARILRVREYLPHAPTLTSTLHRNYADTCGPKLR